MSWLREVPTTLACRDFWSQPNSKKLEIIVGTLRRGFALQGEDFTAREIRSEVSSIRRQPLRSRVDEAVDLLARASKGFLPDGPLGPRPVLASETTLAKVCGASREKQVNTYHSHMVRRGGFKYVLGTLTASNWEEHSSIKFSNCDLAKGVVLPRKPESIPLLMGVIAADNTCHEVQSIHFGRIVEQRDFCRLHLPCLIENSVNYPGAYRSEAELRISKRDYGLTFQSQAFSQWLRKYFPHCSRYEMLHYFSSDEIKPGTVQGFTQAYLAIDGCLYVTNSHTRPCMRVPNKKGLVGLLGEASVEVTPKSKRARQLLIGVNEVERILPKLIEVNPCLRDKYDLLLSRRK